MNKQIMVQVSNTKVCQNKLNLMSNFTTDPSLSIPSQPHQKSLKKEIFNSLNTKQITANFIKKNKQYQNHHSNGPKFVTEGDLSKKTFLCQKRQLFTQMAVDQSKQLREKEKHTHSMIIKKASGNKQKTMSSGVKKKTMSKEKDSKVAFNTSKSPPTKDKPHIKLTKNTHTQSNYLLHTLSEIHKNKGKAFSPQRNSKIYKSVKRQFQLSEILEQDSSEDQLLTPSAKQRKKKLLSREKTKKISQQKTSKKISKKQYQKLDERQVKLIVGSFKEKDEFQRILKQEVISVSFRVLRSKLIEIELLVHMNLEEMHVRLEKGNTECQNINESYEAVEENKIITVLTSIRAINTEDSLYNFPKIIISASYKTKHNSICTLDKHVCIPYSWLHFVQKKNTFTKVNLNSTHHPFSTQTSHLHSPVASLRRSKIKMKTYLENLQLTKNTIKYMNMLFGQSDFKQCSKLNNKGCFEYKFLLEDQEYEIKLLVQESSKKFKLQIEGKGEDRLFKFMQFIACMLA